MGQIYKKERNGVGIILDKEWKEHLVRVSIRSDRIMSIGLGTEGATANILCVYAPQARCEDQEKEDFWNDLYYLEMFEIPAEERCFIGGDLNAHIIGKSRIGQARIHGGWGFGNRNVEGNCIIDFAVACDMAVINSFFKKTEDQYVTYKSGRGMSQIDTTYCV